MQSQFVQKTADITGAILSQLCLVHCVLLPIILGLLPSVSSEFLHGEIFHGLVLVLTTPLAVFALLRGYRKHGSTRPAVFGAAGLTLLWAVFCVEGSINHDLVASFNVMGGLLLAYTHWQNWTLTKLVCDCASRSCTGSSTL